MLESLGLTTYENDTFTTLLQLGESDARELSEKSGVPFGRIYDILSLLESKELVMVQPSRPKKYRPVEPKQAITKLVDQKKQEMKEIEKQAEKIEKELIKLYSPKQRENMFWKVGIGDDLIPSYIELMRQTEKKLLGYIEIHPNVTLEDTEFFFTVIKELKEKGVRMKFLVGTKVPEQVLDIIDQYPEITNNLKIRFIEPMTDPFNILDDKKVILKVRNPIEPENDFAFIYVWDESFARELKTIYDSLWIEKSSRF